MRRRSLRVARPVWVPGVGRGLIESDAQADLDVPFGDADFLDEQQQELLFLYRVEVVDHTADPFGEVVDSAVDLVTSGQGCAGAALRSSSTWRGPTGNYARTPRR